MAKASHHSRKKRWERTEAGACHRIRERFRHLSRSWLWWNCGGPERLGSNLWTFYLQNVHFYSGGTRIRTGGTMIFRSVPKPAVHRHRVPWAESKPLLEGTGHREPPPNAVGRHADVVGLWWTQQVRNENKILSDGTAQDEKSRLQDPAYSFTPPTSCDHPRGTGAESQFSAHRTFGYAGSWIWSSEKSSSTHFGE